MDVLRGVGSGGKASRTDQPNGSYRNVLIDGLRSMKLREGGGILLPKPSCDDRLTSCHVDTFDDRPSGLGKKGEISCRNRGGCRQWQCSRERNYECEVSHRDLVHDCLFLRYPGTVGGVESKTIANAHGSQSLPSCSVPSCPWRRRPHDSVTPARSKTRLPVYLRLRVEG